jgi:biotin carboxyl carrier protein
MKTYKVNVNGTQYMVEIELIDGAAPAQTAAPAAAPTAPAAPAAPSGGETVKSPMPGTILDVKVKAGDKVEEGQVLMILEAMKMENEIMAPKSGTVAAVNVSQGAAVQSGDVLCSIN